VGHVTIPHMPKPVIVFDNFTRFLVENSDESNDVAEMRKAIDQIEDPELRDRVYQRLNVELGVILLRKSEIQHMLREVFQTEVSASGHKKIPVVS